VANCVGALNMRWFLGFLVANAAMMWYGAGLAVLTMWGVLNDAGMLDRVSTDSSGAFHKPFTALQSALGPAVYR
jgi:hypothetical protein